MKRRPKTGEVGEMSFHVTEQHVIDFADEQMPAVLCTPWLIWFLEHAAREAMLPLLEPNESTVGVLVEVPVMLSLVAFANRTRGLLPTSQ